MRVRMLCALLVAAGLSMTASVRDLAGVMPVYTEVVAAGAPPRPEILAAERSDSTPGELRHLPPSLPPAVLENRVMPRKLLPGRVVGSPGSAGPDPVLQENAVSGASAIAGAGFEGVNNVNGVLPPDTNGDVGPNHYIQTVNIAFAIWNKTGTKLYGPANINTLWAGFGGACQTRNDGDPIVLYDHLADRWLIAQFALPRYPVKPFYICIAVSKTADPLGQWSRYAYQFNKMPDYLKFGVWQDGYYMAINQFKSGSGTWGGQGVVAFERSRMLAGQSARAVYFDLYNVDANLGGMLPSHLTGNAPPAGTPNTFAVFDDNSWGYSPDQLQLWDFRVNWTTPSASSFTRNTILQPAPLDSNLCGYARNCIPQRGTTVKVDTLADRLMYRLNYRTFSGYAALVAAHSVDTNGSDRAGVRWYELRRPTGGAWTLHQQGTYAGPDTDNRWMPSIAINKNGTIALGYSVSSTSTFPSIRYTGRLAADPAGDMSQGEGEILAGTGSQTHTSGRWGDYASMSVDPTDGCTFWFTSEYYAAGSSSAGWRTYVGSFKFPDCP